MTRPHDLDHSLQTEINRRHVKVSLPVVMAVYRRGLTASGSNIDGMTRVTKFLDDLSARNVNSPDRDLFPVQAPATKLDHALSVAEQACDAQVSTYLLASAIIPPESPKRAFFLNRALVSANKHPDSVQRVSLTAAVRALVADGNSSLARSLRARRQLRDRYGRWIEMGGGVRFKVRSPGAAGGGQWYHGRVEGVDVPNGRVDVRLADGRLVKVPNDKLEQPKAILNLPGMPLVPNTDPEDLDPNAPEVDRLRTTDEPANRIAAAAPNETELTEGANDAGQNLLRAIPEDSSEREAADQVAAAVREALGAPNLSRADIQERVGNAAAFAERRGAGANGPEAEAWEGYAEALRDVSAAAAPEDPNQEIGEPDAVNDGTPTPDEFLDQYNVLQGIYDDYPAGSELRERVGLIGNVIANVGRQLNEGEITPERAAALLGQVDRMVDWTLDDPAIQQELNPAVTDAIRDMQVDVGNMRERLANVPAAETPEAEAEVPEAEVSDPDAQRFELQLSGNDLRRDLMPNDLHEAADAAGVEILDEDPGNGWFVAGNRAQLEDFWGEVGDGLFPDDRIEPAEEQAPVSPETPEVPEEPESARDDFDPENVNPFSALMDEIYNEINASEFINPQIREEAEAFQRASANLMNSPNPQNQTQWLDALGSFQDTINSIPGEDADLSGEEIEDLQAQLSRFEQAFQAARPARTTAPEWGAPQVQPAEITPPDEAAGRPTPEELAAAGKNFVDAARAAGIPEDELAWAISHRDLNPNRQDGVVRVLPRNRVPVELAGVTPEDAEILSRHFRAEAEAARRARRGSADRAILDAAKSLVNDNPPGAAPETPTPEGSPEAAAAAPAADDNTTGRNAVIAVADVIENGPFEFAADYAQEIRDLVRADNPDWDDVGAMLAGYANGFQLLADGDDDPDRIQQLRNAENELRAVANRVGDIADRLRDAGPAANAAPSVGNDTDGNAITPGDRIELPDSRQAQVTGPANEDGEVPVAVLDDEGNVDYDFDIPQEELDRVRRLFEDPAAEAAPAPEPAVPTPEAEAAPETPEAATPEVPNAAEEHVLDQFGEQIPEGVNFNPNLNQVAGVEHYTYQPEGGANHSIDVFEDAEGQPVYLVRNTDEGGVVGEFDSWDEALGAIVPEAAAPSADEGDQDLRVVSTDLEAKRADIDRRRRLKIDERDRPMPDTWQIDMTDDGTVVYRGPENYQGVLDENGNIVVLRREDQGPFAQIGVPVSSWGDVNTVLQQDLDNRPAEQRNALAAELRRRGFDAATIDAALHITNAEEMRQLIRNSPRFRDMAAQPVNVEFARLNGMVNRAQDLEGAEPVPEGELPEVANRRQIAREVMNLAEISDVTMNAILTARTPQDISNALRADPFYMEYVRHIADLGDVDVLQERDREEMRRYGALRQMIEAAGDLPETSPGPNGGNTPPPSPETPPDSPLNQESPLAEWERELLGEPAPAPAGIPPLPPPNPAVLENLRNSLSERRQPVLDAAMAGDSLDSYTEADRVVVKRRIQVFMQDFADQIDVPTRQAFQAAIDRLSLEFPEETDDSQRGPTPSEAVDPSVEPTPTPEPAAAPEAEPGRQGIPRPPGADPARRGFHDANGITRDRYGKELYRGVRVRTLAGLGNLGVVQLVNEAEGYVTIQLDDGRRVVRSANRVVGLDTARVEADRNAPAAAPAAPAGPPIDPATAQADIDNILGMHRAGAGRGFPLNDNVVAARNALEDVVGNEDMAEMRDALDRAIAGYEAGLNNDRAGLPNNEFWADVEQRLARARALRDRVGAAVLPPVDIPAVLNDVAAFRAEVPRNQRAAGSQWRWRAGFALQDAVDALRANNIEAARGFFDVAATRFRRAGSEQEAVRAEEMRDRLGQPANAPRPAAAADDRVQPADWVAPRHEDGVNPIGRNAIVPGVADFRDDPQAVRPDNIPDVAPLNPAAAQRDFNAWGTRANEIAQAARVRPNLGNMFGLQGQELQDAVKAAFGADEFGVVFGGKNLTLKMTNATSTGNQIDAQFDIMSGGQRVGKTHRQLKIDASGKMSVYNALMQITDNSMKKNGFASAYNRYMENWYIANGVKKVDVSAGLDAGGFVWALNGFGWKNPRGNDPANLLRNVERNARTEQERAQVSILQRRLRAGDIPTPMEMALVGWSPSKGEADTWAGKSGMLSTSWGGTKKLAPKDFNIGQAQNYELAKNARGRASRGENAVQLDPEFVENLTSGVVPGLAEVGLGPNQIRDIVDVLSRGTSLANIPFAQKQKLNTWVNDRLRKGELDDTNLLALRAGLNAEIRADYPELSDLGVGEVLRDVAFDDVKNNRVPGFTVTAPEAGGINDTYKVTHDESGHVFYYKRERAGSRDMERDVAEFLRNAGWRGYGKFEIHNTDPQVVIQQRAGDAMDFAERPKNAVRVREHIGRVPYANYDDPIRFALLDSLIANGDRHENNFQIGKDRQNRWWIFPIDHGLAQAYHDLRGRHRPSQWFHGRNRIMQNMGQASGGTARGQDKTRADLLRIIAEYRAAIQSGQYVNTNFVQNMLGGLDDLEQNIDRIVRNFV